MTSVLESVPCGLDIVLSENLLGFLKAHFCSPGSSSRTQHPLHTGLVGDREQYQRGEMLMSA